MLTPYKNWTSKQVEDVKNNKIAQGKTYAQCAYFARAHLHRGFRPVKGKVAESRNLRGKKFFEMHEKGMSYSQISLEAGLTRQRIHAIIQSYLKSIKVDV
jgi:hypothetical protein